MTDVERNIQENRDSWQAGPYFADAEQYIDTQWAETIWPLIHDFDFGVTVDLACGHGRNVRKLLPLSGELHLVDVTPECIDAARARFADQAGVRIFFHLNDGLSLPAELAGQVTCVYSWDAMVHFERSVVENYLPEVARVLRPGGHSFLHHSDLAATPHLIVGWWRENPGWRSAMSRLDVTQAAQRAGLTVVRQTQVPWGEFSDCVTILRK